MSLNRGEAVELISLSRISSKLDLNRKAIRQCTKFGHIERHFQVCRFYSPNKRFSVETVEDYD